MKAPHLEQMLAPQNGEIIVATDHFDVREPLRYMLAAALTEPREDLSPYAQTTQSLINRRVTGLWVPRSQIDDFRLISEITNVAQGMSTSAEPYTSPRQLKVIYDTSSSGGVDDINRHVKHIIANHPAPQMLFTVSVNAEEEGMRFLTSEFAEHPDVGFLISGVYPEHSPDGIIRTHDKNEAELTYKASSLAIKHGLLGVVGYGQLAKYTKIGQPYISLGVCIGAAEDYVSEVGDSGFKVRKRMTTPEETYIFARNTSVVVGRTLFQQQSGNYIFPDSEGMTDQKYLSMQLIIARNLVRLIRRLNAIPVSRSMNDEEINELVRSYVVPLDATAA